MVLPGYFLIVAGFIKWAKEQGIPVGPGRGSGAGSVVAWSLTITDLDPIKLGLLFERFLNPERVSMPDFAIAFRETRRGEGGRSGPGTDRTASAPSTASDTASACRCPTSASTSAKRAAAR